MNSYALLDKLLYLRQQPMILYFTEWTKLFLFFRNDFVFL